MALLIVASCGGDEHAGTEPTRTFAVQVPRTGQTASRAAGDDGATQRGAAWPSPRFTDPDGTLPVSGAVVLDRLTGLVWTANANAPGPVACGPGRQMNWLAALTYVDCLNAQAYLGFTDWHLPNRTELISLLDYEPRDWPAWMASQGFADVMTSYWSSTIFSDASPTNQLRWAVWSASTDIRYSRDELHVWPVRGAAASLPRTGQATSYAAGDDGDLRLGAVWPEPRFTRPAGTDGVLLDGLTGLMWTQDAHAPGPTACNPGVPKSWADALSHVDCLNAHRFLGHSDWALPNINELESLVPLNTTSPFYWLNTHGFRNVGAAAYWSSTTVAAADSPFAWVIVMTQGYRGPADKPNPLRVWPVRRWRAVDPG